MSKKIYIPFLNKLGNAGDLVIMQTIAGKKYFKFISLTDLKSILGI